MVVEVMMLMLIEPTLYPTASRLLKRSRSCEGEGELSHSPTPNLLKFEVLFLSILIFFIGNCWLGSSWWCLMRTSLHLSTQGLHEASFVPTLREAQDRVP